MQECHESMLPPASFFSPEVSCVETDCCGFSVQILHFSTFVPSTLALPTLPVVGVLGVPALCPFSCALWKSHSLDLTSSTQRKAEGAGIKSPFSLPRGWFGSSLAIWQYAAEEGRIASLKPATVQCVKWYGNHRMTWWWFKLEEASEGL